MQEIMTLVQQRQRALSTALGRSPTDDSSDHGNDRSPLRQHLNLLIQVANGGYVRSRTTDATMRAVEEAQAAVLDVLLGNAMHAKVPIRDDFWQTDIGILISRVRWWISVDELITISNAAALAFGTNTQANRMRIVRAIDKGLLDWVPDPSVANRQQNKRVLRPQVERLRDLRQLPE